MSYSHFAELEREFTLKKITTTERNAYGEPRETSTSIRIVGILLPPKVSRNSYEGLTKERFDAVFRTPYRDLERGDILIDGNKTYRITETPVLHSEWNEAPYIRATLEHYE